MNEPSIIMVAFGTATVIFLPMVLISVYVLDYGYLGVCICTSIHLLLRFVVSYACITFKTTFVESNQSAQFWSRNTV